MLLPLSILIGMSPLFESVSTLPMSSSPPLHSEHFVANPTHDAPTSVFLGTLSIATIPASDLTDGPADIGRLLRTVAANPSPRQKLLAPNLLAALAIVRVAFLVLVGVVALLRRVMFDRKTILFLPSFLLTLLVRTPTHAAVIRIYLARTLSHRTSSLLLFDALSYSRPLVGLAGVVVSIATLLALQLCLLPSATTVSTIVLFLGPYPMFTGLQLLGPVRPIQIPLG